MIIKEYRIPMPMTLEEYNIAQLYATMETSKLETGGGDGVEDILNEPFSGKDLGLLGVRSGQYTKKKLHLDHKIPTFVRILTPKGCLCLQEESWNAFPHCKTILTNEFLGERLIVTIETVHLADNGTTENALNLPPEKLQHREVVYIDIASNLAPSEESCINSGSIEGIINKKTGRGPLEPSWYKQHNPVMTCYKLVTVEVKIFPIQSRIETFIVKAQRRMFLAFHRRIFISMDDWYGLTMDDIRELELELVHELNQLRRGGDLRGTCPEM